MALILDVGPEDTLRIGETTITVLKKSGRRARLRINGSEDVEMKRATDEEKPEQVDVRPA
jgi:hypothetical protein